MLYFGRYHQRKGGYFTCALHQVGYVDYNSNSKRIKDTYVFKFPGSTNKKCPYIS